MASTVWTGRRRWLGNLIPALFWLPFAAFGVFWMVRTGEAVGPGLWSLIGATVVAWIAVNYFGFFENARMKRQLQLILESRGEPIGDAAFVGMATPTYSSMVDPHEDVGFLRFLPDRLSFISETRVVELFREQVGEVRYRANVHSLIGLGRWVSVEGELDGKPIRLMVELRDHRTLLANRRGSHQLLNRMKRWLSSP